MAVDSWNAHPEKVSFMLNLGDTIDIANSNMNSSQEALDKVLCEFSRFQGAVHHTWGNHEMYNFLRSDLLGSQLNSSPVKQDTQRKSYYSFNPHKNFCFIMMDTYEIGVFGFEKDDPILKQAEKFLDSKNANENKTCNKGLEGVEKRFVNYNAGVSEEQLQWLDETLSEAQRKQQYVIIGGKNTA